MTTSTWPQQYLISWFHPTERAFDLDADAWVIGQNSDFGYEVLCATVTADNKDAARALIGGSYVGTAGEIHIRSCHEHSDFAQELRDGERGRRFASNGRALVAA